MAELMEIDSKPYGKMQVDIEQLIAFPSGIFGFERYREYYLLDKDEGPFYWLQSNTQKELAFIITNPIYFKRDYELKLSEQDFKDIELQDKNITTDLLHFVIVTLPMNNDPSKMTANLLGPIIINAKKRIGKQAISLYEGYTTRHNILTSLEASIQSTKKDT